MNVVAKFFLSHSWQAKFADISRKLNDNTTKLQQYLTIHTNRGVAAANEILIGLRTDVNMLMKMVFENMRSKEETEITTFIATKGGAEKVLGTDDLMAELIKRLENSASLTGQSMPLKGEDKSMLEEVRRDLAKNLDDILQENRDIFAQKFQVQQVELEKLHHTVVKEGDRVISAIISGPHDRIVNKVCCLIAT